MDSINDYIERLELLSQEEGKERMSIKLATKILSIEKNATAYFLRGLAKSKLNIYKSSS